jgi:hypothetical protein
MSPEMSTEDRQEQQPRRATRVIVIAFVVLESLAVLGGESRGGRYARLFWPFNDAAMFTDNIVLHHYRELQLFLVSRDGTRKYLSFRDVLHPNVDVGEWATVFRIERTPTRWNETFDRGMVKAVNRYRCAHGLAGDVVQLERAMQTVDAFVRKEPATESASRTVIRRLELPPCS